MFGGDEFFAPGSEPGEFGVWSLFGRGGCLTALEG